MNGKSFRALRAELEGVLVESLSKGGGYHPEEIALHVVESLPRGDNPKRVASTRPQFALPQSTLSERLTRLHIQGFLYTFNRLLAKTAIRRLHQLPPDGGEVLGIIDGHQESYHYERHRHQDDCRRESCRCHYKILGHSENKARWTHEWVIMALAWRHQGERYVLPIFAKPFLGLPYPAKRQVEDFARLVRRYRIRVAILLLDRLYDAADVRLAAAKYRLPVGHRVRWQTNPSRYAFPIDGKGPVTFVLLEKEALERGEWHTWRDRRSGTPHAERILVRRVHFPTEKEEYDFVVSVPVHTRSDQPGVWHPGRPFAVAVTAGLGPLALRLYRRRWNIESMFHQWALDRSRPRSKTMHAHIVLFCAFFLFRSLAAFAKILFVISWTGPKTSAFRNVSTIELGRLIVEQGTPPG